MPSFCAEGMLLRGERHGLQAIVFGNYASHSLAKQNAGPDFHELGKVEH